MSQEHLTYDDLLRIVELIKSSEQFSEFRLKVGEIEIELRRRRPGDAGGAAAPTSPSATRAPEAPEPTPRVPRQEPVPRSAPTAPAPSWPPGAIVIRAPMIGTFYRSPQPGAPPFVAVGQAVEADTTVCIIEVMKLMNSIPAGVRGVVSRVLVDDGAAVEAGAPLVVVDPEQAS